MKIKKIDVFLLILFVTGMLVVFLLKLDDKIRDIIILVLGSFSIGVLVDLWLNYIDNYSTVPKKDKEEINKKYEDIKNSVISKNSNTKHNSDILELMLANMKEIEDYYVLSKTQAKNSFFLAVSMCIVGLVLMGISIFASFFSEDNLISTIIPAVGSAIVEVIAGTSLMLYKNSLSQLNRYFDSLHSNERFLSVVNLVSKASPEVQDDMYFEIIRSQTGVVSINNDEYKEKDEKLPITK